MAACKSESVEILDDATDGPIETMEERRVDKKLLKLNPNEGLVYYEGTLFTGDAMDIISDKVVGLTPFNNGKKEGIHQKWFADGTLSFQAEYKDGRLNGDVYSWWRNGAMRSHSKFKHGIAHGLQTQWYQSGARFKERNLVQGNEEGMQKAWRENGKIYNNYKAINGRIFGLKRATLCFELDNEIVTFND